MKRWILEHSFNVDAAHCLLQLPEDHPCHKLHGHTWKFGVKICARALDQNHFVMDFHTVKNECRERIHDVLDHKIMNEQLSFIPTCELLAEWAFNTVKDYLWGDDYFLMEVKVTENIEAGNSVTFMEMTDAT
jgi:6-pyruvoyltetrahydropterin/6-carboxytetrahydropterin synthase